MIENGTQALGDSATVATVHGDNLGPMTIWNQDEYRERKRLREMASAAVVNAQQNLLATVTTDDAWNAIKETNLGPVVTALQSPTDPPLPLEAVIGKALALAGAILTKPVADYDPNDPDGDRGIDLAKFKIMTAMGQATNIWTLVVGESGAGKDIGNLADLFAAKFGVDIGSSGSASGIADAYVQNGSGLLIISEFEPFLDERCWQSKARMMLTAAFNKGHFNVRLSNRGDKQRICRYCYPSVIANIQPGVIRRHADSVHISSGFLPRFLITTLPRRLWVPATGRPNLSNAMDALRLYDELEGEVVPEAGYLHGLRTAWHERGVLPLVASRYCNEYAPRIACILQADGKTIRAESWGRASVIVRWFFGMAEEVLGRIPEEGRVTKFQMQVESMFDYIANKTSECGGVTRSDISRNRGRGTTAAERKRILAELVDCDRIKLLTNGKYMVRGAE